MPFFKKISDLKAQHTIEYSVLLILIMAGIIIAGPYVIRSWNANLKGWDDSIQDSFEDPFLSINPDGAPLDDCNTGLDLALGCGGGEVDPCTGDQVSCTPLQMLMRETYSPAGCQCALNPIPPTFYCPFDDRCCEYVARDCGTGSPCGPGEREYLATCGNSAPSIVCGYIDPVGPPNAFMPGGIDPLCVFECLQTNPTRITGATNPYYGDVCPDAETGLLADTIHYSYVNDGECTGAKCEIQCAPKAYSYGDYCDCDFAVDISGCPSGQYNRGGCSGTWHEPCCIPP